jgi:hypothetical protein
MNEGPICGRFIKKTRGQKSRATVPLKIRTGPSSPPKNIMLLFLLANAQLCLTGMSQELVWAHIFVLSEIVFVRSSKKLIE